jgi:two-component system, chemotaxis family, chemotaxis protein CheY
MPKRILVVDDEYTIRELIAETLHEAGYRVDTAANGTEALERMRQTLPDAIVLDVMMPRLDGRGFVEVARLEPALAAVPIVVVTAAYAGRSIAAQLGVNACLTKPFELDDLVRTIERVIAAAAWAGRTAVGEVGAR